MMVGEVAINGGIDHHMASGQPGDQRLKHIPGSPVARVPDHGQILAAGGKAAQQGFQIIGADVNRLDRGRAGGPGPARGHLPRARMPSPKNGLPPFIILKPL